MSLAWSVSTGLIVNTTGTGVSQRPPRAMIATQFNGHLTLRDGRKTSPSYAAGAEQTLHRCRELGEQIASDCSPIGRSELNFPCIKFGFQGHCLFAPAPNLF